MEYLLLSRRGEINVPTCVFSCCSLVYYSHPRFLIFSFRFLLLLSESLLFVSLLSEHALLCSWSSCRRFSCSPDTEMFCAARGSLGWGCVLLSHQFQCLIPAVLTASPGLSHCALCSWKQPLIYTPSSPCWITHTLSNWCFLLISAH